jgi:hypothetical protein
MTRPSARPLEFRERSVALVLTALCAVPHLLRVFHAGGLWRDEVQPVAFAAMAPTAAAWRMLASDGPAGFPALLRVWSRGPWGLSDGGLRALGCVIGLSLLAALWAGARGGTSRAPLISVALLGTNAIVLRWGDAVRSYGAATVCVLLSFALLRRAVDSPAPKRFAAAGLAMILSVQFLYQSAFLVLAVCLAGAAVGLRRRRGDVVALSFLAGLCAAVSLLPYASTISRSQEWWDVMKVPVDASGLWAVLSQALGSPWPWMRWTWAGLFAGALGLAAAASLARKGSRDVDDALYGVVAAAAAAIFYFVFLKRASLPTKPWYYLPPMALIACGIDSALSLPATNAAARRARLLGAVLLCACAAPALLTEARTRQTDVDLIAQELSAAAAPDDLIVVNPWYCGATFHRYYRGRAPWTTLPPLDDYGLQRLDLLKLKLGEREPMRPLLERIAATLGAGRRIWWVGGVDSSPLGEVAPNPPPAPAGPGWHDQPYLNAWTRQASDLLRRRAKNVTVMPALTDDPVSAYENLPVFAASGWRP